MIRRAVVVSYWNHPGDYSGTSLAEVTSHFWLELGPRLGPPLTTLTKRRLYVIRFLARPVRFFFFSAFATFGVWFFTFPARAKLPCTLPMALVCAPQRLLPADPQPSIS